MFTFTRAAWSRSIAGGTSGALVKTASITGNSLAGTSASAAADAAGAEAAAGAEVAASDLRAGAGLVVAGLMAEGTTKISNIEHILRGYSNIVEKLQALGADITMIEE